MNIKIIEFDLDWPIELNLIDLRQYLVEKLREFGDPLRWAITAIEYGDNAQSFRKMRVEAVVIIS